MKMMCEAVFQETLPVVRSIITNEMIRTYGLTQEEVAEKLGITQPAVSQYLTGIRGKMLQQIRSNQKLMAMIKKLTAEIVSGKTKLHENICQICSETRKENIYDEKKVDTSICLIESSYKKNGKQDE